MSSKVGYKRSYQQSKGWFVKILLTQNLYYVLHINCFIKKKEEGNTIRD